ncbi:MAG: TRAP transporter substrate-binding protein [Alphaproteobacteria bacterium]|nr:TRAP transporter substrate-binding protein [Alphaproteobacteria bacterium]
MFTVSRFAGSTILSGAVIAAGLAFAPPASAQTELLINNYLPPKHPFQVGIINPWIKEVMAATNGAVVPTLSAAAVGPPPKNWQTVEKGVADVVLMANLFQTQRIQMPKVAELPLSSPSAIKTSTALWKTHEEYFAKADEYKGAKLVGSFVLTPNVIHSSGKPIRTVDDLKGFKLRAAPGLTTNLLNELGAVPVASGPNKIFGLVSKGVVDGVAVPAHGLRAFRILPFIKSTTLIPGGLSNTTFSLLINQAKWESLTKEQQDQVMSVSGMRISENTAATDKIAAGALKALQEAGGELVEPDPAFVEFLRKFAEGAEADWLKAAEAKGVDGKAAMAFFRAELE